LSSAHSSHDGRHLVEVKQTPEKGLGIFARVRISRGTRIVAEAPLLKATAFSPYGVNVQEPFDRLSSAKQRAYLELHEHASETLKRDNDWESLPELNRKVLAIYAANSFGKDVFWLASRFNHACIPNIHNAYNPVIQMDIFHSIREIEAGEELTVSYTSGFCVRGQRKAQLNKWGFQCRCSACKETPDGNKLEQQLVRLALLSREPGMAVSNILPNKNTLKMHQKMAAIMCSAGFVGKSLHQQ
jgi:SET domain-containing protein